MSDHLLTKAMKLSLLMKAGLIPDGDMNRIRIGGNELFNENLAG